MASIINAGSGSNAELTEPYTTQASQHSLLFGVGGEADTKFPLPTGTSWVVVELHFIEGDESTIAYTEWFDKLTNISSRLIEIQDAIEADSLITNYKIVASHYDHTVANKVDVYRGEHLDGSARVDIVLDSSNVDFTFPVGHWKLSDTVLAPIEIQIIYISFDNPVGDNPPTEPFPNGITINTFDDYTDISVLSLVNENNESTDVTIQWTDISDGHGGLTVGVVTGDNSGCLFDRQLENFWYEDTTGGTMALDIYLPEGTYTIRVSASRDTTEIDRVTEYTLGSHGMQTVQAGDGGNTTEYAEWVNVVSIGETISLSMAIEAGSLFCYISGLNIKKTG